MIFLVFLAVIAIYFVTVYNGLVSQKTRIKASIQEIGNQLKRQADLIPNLEESAKGYLKHEKDILKLLADARKSVDSAVASGDLKALSDAGQKVASILPQIQVVMESNPELKGVQVVTGLMDELRDTSDKVMYARRTLIDLTADYNIKISVFPSNLVAQIFKFGPEAGLATPTDGSFLSVSAEDTKSPKVTL
jgi:LemA protein